MMVRFTVPGRPVTWQRPTDDPRSGRRNVTAKEQREEKQRIAMHALRARPKGWPLGVEYCVEVLGYWPDRRFGDVDRLTNLYLDAFERVLYTTDRQVAAQCSARHVDAKRPRVEVSVCALLEHERASVVIEVFEVAS